ncbi:hypothetical protein KKR91_13025 [Arthrobacter jiangjiafuii]|uniref:Uncharacterized protein n=1 Tax=Arthrobacter jiangjiafuii TaxID=2817475 RepID=A0A975M4Q3_9MICC|nr:hypothetical protein [Arthrobacter jiangjiafuii]MBP3044490.1 hypothetical protein [Arthrobacter jiangjiafuii]QWC09401.1 hypothetical protein KKR91_13025 [Arthrobacter jiangjiafuii]
MTEFVEMPLLPESGASYGGRFDYGVAGSARRAFESEAFRLKNQAASHPDYTHNWDEPVLVEGANGVCSV